MRFMRRCRDPQVMDSYRLSGMFEQSVTIPKNIHTSVLALQTFPVDPLRVRLYGQLMLQRVKVELSIPKFYRELGTFNGNRVVEQLLLNKHLAMTGTPTHDSNHSTNLESTRLKEWRLWRTARPCCAHHKSVNMERAFEQAVDLDVQWSSFGPIIHPNCTPLKSK